MSEALIKGSDSTPASVLPAPCSIRTSQWQENVLEKDFSHD